MKRMIILILLLAMAVFPCMCAAEEAQDPAISEIAEIPDAESEEITLFDIRYNFEHRMLPRQFYLAPERTMDSLMGTGLYDIWCSYTAENTFDTTFRAGDFSARELMRDSSVRMLMLTMPVPNETLLCYRIYLCLDPDSGKAGYYTAEYDRHEGFYDEGCLICGWNPDRTHSFYTEGRILPDEDDPEYKKALAEEATVILNIMRESSKPDDPAG